MKVVRKTGHQLFGDNCAACHGRDGRGRDNYPDLTDDDWLWGGGPEKIAETMRVGINSRHQNTRVAQMPAFGRDAMLDRTQVTNVATYVHSLSNPAASTPNRNRQDPGGPGGLPDDLRGLPRRRRKGQPGGRSAQPDRSVLGLWRRPPDDRQTIHGGRQGHMPTWDERLTPAEIKILAPVCQFPGRSRSHDGMNTWDCPDGSDCRFRCRYGCWRLAVLLFVGANAHLVYVAVSSQPECVAHLKTPAQGRTGFGLRSPPVEKAGRITRKTDERC